MEGGYIPNTDFQHGVDESLPVFSIERVQLQFPMPSDFVAAQIANNAIFLAFATGRILRIDLQDAAEIEDIDLPKKPTEVGIVQRMFLDPTASHLIVSTTFGENFYLHSQSKQPKQLSRLSRVNIESVAWNPSQPTASTREILIGSSDGNIYETYIEPSPEFYRREEKYLKNVYKVKEGPVSGLWIDAASRTTSSRRVLVATPNQLLLFEGKISHSAHEGSGSIYSKYFESESPAVHDALASNTGTQSALSITSESQDHDTVESTDMERTFAWLTAQGIFHGPLGVSHASPTSDQMLTKAKWLLRSQIPPSRNANGRVKQIQGAAASIIMSQWHILQLVDGRIVATNRLDDTVILDQVVLDPGQSALGLFADVKKNTYWLVTGTEIFEVVATDENRDIWKIMLKNERFDDAVRFAKTVEQKDAVATASGDHLFAAGKYSEAAGVYGRSSKPFEQVALSLIDRNEQDALRRYLLAKHSTLKKTQKMQRIMIAAWLVELYMAKLNILDDTITTKAELAEGVNTADSRDQLSNIRQEYQGFVSKNKSDLDLKTTYETISSHGREEELLFFAVAISDYDFVLRYWVQRERWNESLVILKKQSSPDIFYKYSSVLMANAAQEFIDILMRQSNLDAKRLIPALLNYNDLIGNAVPLNQNQAIRYLNYVVNTLQSTESSIHNTLISLYASSSAKEENALLSYLRAQSYAQEQLYDADFALRLCIQYQRVQSCVHIYTAMSQFGRAVDLALKHDEIELAAAVADRAENDTALRKRLWLAIAKVVIHNSTGIKSAIEFLKRCDLLRIEDLIPFFPEFVVIDDFKEEICQALEEYSRHIDSLKREMDDSALTAAHIKNDIKQLEERYAIVESGEKCYTCRLPLLARQFFVFPCQHAFHADCLGKTVTKHAAKSKGRRIKDLQTEVSKGLYAGKRREKSIKELDELVAASCVLCSELAVKQIDEPFVVASDNTEEWAL